MTTTAFRQLNDYHLLHRIWLNELETAQQQLAFYEKLLLPLQTSVENGSKAILLTGEVAHFQRLIPLMTAELQGIESDMAEVVQNQTTISPASKKEQRYLQEEMDDFDANYARFKKQVRQFLADIII